jgi:hypothetical protein
LRANLGIFSLENVVLYYLADQVEEAQLVTNGIPIFSNISNLQKVTDSYNLTIHFRSCISGEVYRNGICQVCPNG